MSQCEYDFVFVYEVKNRELENDCLIACELERRGYKVGFINTWDQEVYRDYSLKTNVAIAFALYSDRQLNFIDYHVADCDKFLNMQWEQVFTNLTASQNDKTLMENAVNYFGVTGNAKKAVHIAWGKTTFDRLVNGYHLEPRNIKITGHVALDFMRPALQPYFMNKEELFNICSLPIHKKVCLFISSFSYVNVPEATMEWINSLDNGCNPNVMASLSTLTQKQVLDWIEKALIADENLVFVYRPHPAENDNPVLLEMAERLPNFYVIDDYSIKQWILTVDKIYTWMSTSVAEIYAANKPCGILRPIELPFDYDMENYNGADVISDYSEFEKSLNSELDFPINKETLEAYYHIDPECPSYIKICDVLEEIYNDDSYTMNCPHGVRTEASIKKFNRYMHWKHKLINSERGRAILNKHYPNWNNDLDNYNYTMAMYRKNHSTKQEIEDIKNKIRNILFK